MTMNTEKILYKDESFKIIQACLTVFNELGTGFLEAVYQDALMKEFELLKLPFQREKEFYIHYKDFTLNKKYIADFVCYDKIILELKALDKLSGIHEAQLLNYLKASGLHLGIVVNFGDLRLVYKRIVL
jgi:GxxExxY protein